MIELNWAVFGVKYRGRERQAFQSLAEDLFCNEYDQFYGIHSFEDQTGIETDTIQVENQHVGFQAKFLEVIPSQRQSVLIEAIKSAKNLNPELTTILFYINRGFKESSLPENKEPKAKIKIEKSAKEIGVKVIWKVPSQIRQQLIQPSNEHLYLRYFSMDEQCSSEQILNKFKLASFHLKNVNSHFEKLPNSHIPRKETDQLLEWLENPLKENEKGIMLLVGDAGYGKSVILKDLYQRLESIGTPVLGIKADKYYAESKKDLQQKLDFESPIEDMIETLGVSHEQVVVVIDQIDALSQSLSAKRDYLNSFQMLVNSLLSITRVRVVLSTRTYDLQYDSDLRFFKSQKPIKVTVLEKEEVEAVLKAKGVDPKHVNPRLFELIRVPHHLNVLCKISQSKSNLQSIQTLHDLYNELWYQKITHYAEGQKCKQVIFEIAAAMHQEQKISISKYKVNEACFSAIEYLKSNTLLTEVENEVQFFHQTFFDYSFAKQFVESGQQLAQYLSSGHQGLFIRSGLKMIMSFLRDHNIQSYIDSLQSILKNKKYRFHIKMLLVTELAYREHPNSAEKNLVKDSILSDNLFKYVFLEAVNTYSWLDFLHYEGRIINMVSSNQTSDFGYVDDKSDFDKLNVIFQLFRRYLPDNRKLVLKILDDLPDFEDKSRFVYRILYFLKEWDDERAIVLFAKYSENEVSKDLFGFYKILEDAAKDKLSWVFDTYGKYLYSKSIEQKSRYDHPELGHDDYELIKKLFDINLEEAFDFVLDFVKASTANIQNYFDDDLKIQRDLPIFFVYEKGHRNNYQGIYNLLIDQAKILSVTNPNKYREFVNHHLDSRSLSVLTIICLSLQESPKVHSSVAFRFLTTFLNRGGVRIDSPVDYYVRQLIRLSYPHFTKIEKDKLNHIILNLHIPREYSVSTRDDGKKRHYLQWYGNTMYEYLCAIPEDLLLIQSNLKTRYQELKRKFGEFKEKRPHGGISWSSVPSPLPIRAYENMSHKDWENSFLRYSKESREGYGSLKGSKMEHSRSFKSQVAKRPLDFCVFVEQLIDDDRIDHDYILSGLTGLVEGEYDPVHFKVLFKKVINLNLDVTQSFHAVQLTDYLINSNNCDGVIIDYLCRSAVEHEDPISSEKEYEDYFRHGIITVRGAAARRLLYLSEQVESKEKIFDTIEKVMSDFSLSVKSTMIPNLHYLSSLDEDRTLKILLDVVDTKEIELIKHTPLTAQILSEKYFYELQPYFNQCLELNQDDLHGNLATLLALLWIDEKEDCYSLLNRFLEKSEKARSNMIDVWVQNLSNGKPTNKERVQSLFLMFLDCTDEKVMEEYSTAFLHLQDQEIDFLEIYPLMIKYSKSTVVKSSPHYYYEFLLANCKKYPKECLELITEFKNYDKPDITKSGYYDDDPIRVLLGAYDSLMKIDNVDSVCLEKCMEVFDEMLMDDRFRLSAQNVIDHV